MPKSEETYKHQEMKNEPRKSQIVVVSDLINKIGTMSRN
jgi:hypothetical protein